MQSSELNHIEVTVKIWRWIKFSLSHAIETSSVYPFQAYGKL